MASKTYYIYEIPGVKIGCTWNVKKRVEKQQGYTNYKILEQHTDIIEASRREIELQKQYGYKVDTTPYYKIYEQSSKGGKKNVESGHISNLGRKYGKIQGKKSVDSGHLASIASLGGKIAGKKAVESGHMAALGKIYGKIYGKKAVESGHLARIASLGGKIAGKLSRKLTFEQAEEIRKKFTKMDGGKGVRYDTLAAEYNVSPSAIKLIIYNKTYKEQ